MIRNPIRFSSGTRPIVTAYDSQRTEDKDGAYWDDQAVDDVRKEIKQHYIAEQQYRCCYCGFSLLSTNGRIWDVEHVVPRVDYPWFLFEPENLAVACVDCNSAKRDKEVLFKKRRKRYPRESSAFRICHPHYDVLEDHVVVFFERFFFPMSDKGRATIEICGLLRFAYEYMKWDAGIADNTRLQDAFRKAMNATDGTTATAAMMEALVVVGVRVLR